MSDNAWDAYKKAAIEFYGPGTARELEVFESGWSARDSEVAGLWEEIKRLQENGKTNREQFAAEVAALKARVEELEAYRCFHCGMEVQR